MADPDVNVKAGVTATVVSGGEVNAVKITGNINTFIQQAASAAEEHNRRNELELKNFAEGISSFAQRLKKIADDPLRPESDVAYKGLLEYNLGDSRIFFGRNRVSEVFIKQINGGRLTVLQSESGAGKSSLLQASISARLLSDGHLPVYLRTYTDNPTLDIKRILLPNLDDHHGLRSGTLRAYLIAAANILGKPRLYLFLDQFEDFFTRFDEPVRTSFIDQLAGCLSDSSLDVHWVLSLRTEFFGRLASYEPPLQPYSNRFLLKPLDLDAARDAIIGPAAKFEVTFEPTLVDAIINDLSKSESDNDQITPPQLQLVCLALYESRGEQSQIKLDNYKTMGGAVGILRSYLSNVLKNLPEKERKVSPLILESLLDSNKQRVRLTHEELMRQPGLCNVETNILDSSLRLLTARRLLRVQKEEDADAATYELSHDYLVEEINLSDRVLARKRVQELLDQTVSQFAQHQTLLSREELAVIEPYRSEINISEEAHRLIRTSERRLKRQRHIVYSIGSVVIALVAATAILLIVFAITTRSLRQAQSSVALLKESQRRLFANNGIVTVGAQPSALVFDGSKVWVASSGENTVQAIEVVTGIADPALSVGRSPADLVFDGKRIWVANAGDNTLQAIEAASGKIGRPIPLNDTPRFLTYDGKRVWVTSGDDYVQAVETETGNVKAPVKVGEIPTGLAFVKGKVWVANKNDATLQSIDPETGTVGEAIAVGLNPDFLTADGEKLWFGSGPFGAIRSFDPMNNHFGGDPSGDNVEILNLSFDGSQLWAANGNSTIQMVDPSTTKRVGTPIQVGSSPADVVFDGERAWVLNSGDNTAQCVNASSAGLTEPIKLGFVPRTLSFDGKRVWIADSGSIQAVDPVTSTLDSPIKFKGLNPSLFFDGQMLWMVSQGIDNTLRSIDPKAKTLSDPININEQPRGIVFDGQRLWISSMGADDRSHTLKAINPVNRSVERTIQVGETSSQLVYLEGLIWFGDSDEKLHAIDPKSGSLVKTIETPKEVISKVTLVGPPYLASDGRRLWATGINVMWVFEPHTGELVATIKYDRGATAFAFDGKRMWISDEDKNSVYYIDSATFKVSRPIYVGAKPRELVFDGRKLWITYSDQPFLRSILIHR